MDIPNDDGVKLNWKTKIILKCASCKKGKRHFKLLLWMVTFFSCWCSGEHGGISLCRGGDIDIPVDDGITIYLKKQKLWCFLHIKKR